jgi:CRISPR system Cascade subunit CasA
VTGVDWAAKPVPEPVAGSRKVYHGNHTLLRALGVLAPHLDGRPLVLPDDISPLVQAAYGDEELGPPEWVREMTGAREEHERFREGQRKKAEAFLLAPARRPGRPVYGWLAAHAGDADDSPAGRAQVRDSEDSLEVLVVQRREDGSLATLPDLGGGRGGIALPQDFPPARKAAEAVAASALALPWQFTKPWVVDRTIAELERTLVPAWQVKECPWLAGELLLVLDERCQTRLAGYELRYSTEEGMRVVAGDTPPARATGQDAPGNDAGSGEDGTREDNEDRGAAPGAAGAGGPVTVTTPAPTRPPEARETAAPTVSFDLTERPWIPVQRLDNSLDVLSLREVFAQARQLRRLAGDLATQDFALLRLLLAILHDTVDGPETLEDWGELWEADDPFARVPGYLDQHRDRFDLLHPERPFFQVAGLRTEKDEIASLNRIVADVPNGDPFFTMRHPGVDRLGYAEAARWLVHAHAYDPSGIKSGMVGDDRARSGKVYPLGVGSAGMLGGITAEGADLAETLLLNLVATDASEGIVEFPKSGARSDAEGKDLPAWRRPPCDAGGEKDGLGQNRSPAGLRDLYTWQSRRVRLHHDGRGVTGVVLGYGDPLALPAPWHLEPMTGWRRSPAQEKKQGRALVYMPRQHDPARSAWRGLEPMLRATRETTDDRGETRDAPPRTLPSGIVRWLSHLSTEDQLDPGTIFRLRLTGVVYGTQQSVVDEVVDDSLTMPALLLKAQAGRYLDVALDAVRDAEEAVRALGRLAGNLARAVGADTVPATDAAHDLGFGDLDGPYRRWLARLGGQTDPDRARQEWRDEVRRRIGALGRELLNEAPSAASEGRVIELSANSRQWVNDAHADLWFRAQLDRAVPRSATPADPGHPDSPNDLPEDAA